MSRTMNILKKISAFFLAAAIAGTIGIEAFAEPMEGTRNPSSTTSLEEVPEQNAEIAEKLTAPLDFTGLEYQVAIANGLNEYDYTKESWSVLKDSVIKALIIIDEAKEQSIIDNAEKELEAAINGLVKMDYSGLEKALGIVYSMMEENSGYIDTWEKIDDAAERARKALISGDQTEVNNLTDELYSLVEEAKGFSIGEEKEPEIVIKEVEVQVPPSDDFCNIAGHKAWPVLFIISFVLNIAMIGFVAFILQKKRNTDDTIPLVQYDIDDDMDMDIDDIEDIDDEDM